MSPPTLLSPRAEPDLTDTSPIRDWRSIVTLVVFVVTNIIVLFPFHITVYVPWPLWNAWRDLLAWMRITAPRHSDPAASRPGSQSRSASVSSARAVELDPIVQEPETRTKHLHFPMDMVTAPLIADLFLLAILAIGRDEVKAGTLGANNIQPIDIMAFFFTLAYIAISIDASGLIRYLAFKVLTWGGKVGHRLFFFLYAFFFCLGTFIGNDPIILSGTAFLAYMTRVSANIVHPRAWIYSQFAVANIASAILVSSNPTNLVLAGAFQIAFIEYTANMIVPAVLTALFLFPFLLYIIFADEALIPLKIEIHDLPQHLKDKKPVNPNIPNARGNAEQEENDQGDDQGDKQLSLEEIMNPFLDKKGAAFGALIMAATLITLLAVNAARQDEDEISVYWVTLPAAFVMFVYDLAAGWLGRHQTREIAGNGRRDIQIARQRAQEEREAREASEQREEDMSDLEDLASENNARRPGPVLMISEPSDGLETLVAPTPDNPAVMVEPDAEQSSQEGREKPGDAQEPIRDASRTPSSGRALLEPDDKQQADRPSLSASSSQMGHDSITTALDDSPRVSSQTQPAEQVCEKQQAVAGNTDLERTDITKEASGPDQHQRATLVSLSKKAYRWCQETFPTSTAVISHLPFALVPFAFSMFVLVQALVTKGWVPVFAWGWHHWVLRTGTVGAIGGMGFLSVILCNFAGTNIGTTILLSRVIQSWVQIHEHGNDPISQRTFWATVYSMAIGVNYGAFSTAFSASLAGLLWRDILFRKHIKLSSLEFARVNLPIIAIAMTIGCAVLVGQVYITRTDDPYTGEIIID